LSQEELASRLNVSFATVNRWENGKAQPQGQARDAIIKLLDEFGGDQLVLRGVDEAGEDAEPRRRKRGTAKSAVLSTKSMEQMLWDAACSIRGEKDAPKFKDYILPLIFPRQKKTARSNSRNSSPEDDAACKSTTCRATTSLPPNE
jgi:type I restriction enzyme M protein